MAERSTPPMGTVTAARRVVEPYEVTRSPQLPEDDPRLIAALEDLCTATMGMYYAGDGSSALLKAVTWLRTRPDVCQDLGLAPVSPSTGQDSTGASASEPEVHVVTYGNYLHGVFATQEAAEAYMGSRPEWADPAFRSTMRVACETWTVGHGWDPETGVRRLYPDPPTSSVQDCDDREETR